ncbi:ABC transporter permease [Kineosporia rhizophila]|uniref:ABC transporter permease n=1 Tax=Kineosporia TaxID=49184 RepID=UPI001E33D834|nr:MULTISPECIES: ABC transporter permease [Kineosporia]MCE0535520.1 ABC transporter permease [Kineosporia rhizophila]GLY16688.1 ABC transporter permease [Kineosporia sp. NBRC 101677]
MRGSESPRLDPLDLLGLGLLGIRTRKARAALSALGIAIGVATLVLVTAVPASSRQALDEELSALGTDRLQAAPAPDQDPPVQLPAEAADMVARIGPVTHASAVGDWGLRVTRTDRTGPGDFNALAVLAARTDLLQAVEGTVREGKFLDPATAAYPTAVLGKVAADRLGFSQVGVDEPARVFVGGRWFTVIGILDPVPLSAELDRAVMVGWPVAADLLRFDGRPTRIYVRTSDEQVEAVEQVLAATVFPQHPSDVLVTRPADALSAKRAVAQTFGALFLALAGVALLVGGIGVANTMYISVLERRREIGLRRALGAHRGQIRTQFVTESVVLSLLGAAAGVSAGVLAVLGYCAFQGWPVTIPPGATLGGLGGAVVIGALAGLYPAVRAARTDPTESLSSV